VLRYAITDQGILAPKELPHGVVGQARLLERCALLARRGVDFIQLRDKELAQFEIEHLAALILANLRAISGHTKLLVNAHPDTALSIGADGVHLTSNSSLNPLDVISAFRVAGRPAPTVSISCHTLSETLRARDLGVSLILFGPIFGKSIHGESVLPGIGLEALAEACRSAAPVPVLALGGVTDENTPACLAAGATGVAGIRLFMT